MFWKLTWNEFKLFLREPMAAFFTLAFPLLLLFLFGGIFGNKPSQKMAGLGMMDVSVPGYIGMIIGTIALLSLPVAVVTYREKGILRRLRATPLSPVALLGSQVAVHLLILILGSLLLTTAGFVFFDLRPPRTPIVLVLAVTLASSSFLALGFVLAGFLATSRTASAVGMSVFFPMLFLSGAAMPRALFPDSIKTIGDFLPLTHVVQLVGDAWHGRGLNTLSALVLAGVFVVCLGISWRSFKWE